jgi:phage shock protein PspC (stress-responsive transcriptional regulator)
MPPVSLVIPHLLNRDADLGAQIFFLCFGLVIHNLQPLWASCVYSIEGVSEMDNRRLTRCESDRMVAGVCSGLGHYLNIDPTIVRLIFVLMFLLGGHGLLVYIILWIVMPSDNKSQSVVEVKTNDQA